MEFLSECCDSQPILEIDEATMTGFCGHCLDTTGFYDEATICVECGEVRTDDERVTAGMKCGPCAYA